MRIPRIHHPERIHQLGSLALGEDAAGHVGRVLPVWRGQDVLLFDMAVALNSLRPLLVSKNVTVNVTRRIERMRISVELTFRPEVISRGDKMELSSEIRLSLVLKHHYPRWFQSAVALSLILNASRKSSRSGAKIAIAACEQSGRNTVPVIRPIIQRRVVRRTEWSVKAENLHHLIKILN